MSTWGPDEWAMAWQSAPAHVLQGRAWGGHTGTAPAGADSTAGSTGAASGTEAASGMEAAARGAERRSSPDHGAVSRRPPDGRPPLGRPPLGRPPLGRPPLGRPPLGRPSTRRARLTRRTAGISDPPPAGSADGPGGADLQQLETRIRGMAADLAASMCEWLHLIEQFDREDGWAGVGLSSCAAWLSWTCSVAPGTAREYVRIARALPLLPLIDGAFAAGRLSYSKVRVLIQVAAEVDEAVLLQQAQVQTVSQLERTVRAFRRTDGWSQERKRRTVWRWDDDGMLVVSARLPADEGALFVAGMERSRDDIAPRPDSDACDAPPGPPSGDGTTRHPMPEPTEDDRRRAALTGADPLGMAGADMLVALARRALAAGDVDSSGDDRHLLVLHADLAELIGDEESGDAPSAEPFADPPNEPGDESAAGVPSRDARKYADGAINEPTGESVADPAEGPVCGPVEDEGSGGPATSGAEQSGVPRSDGPTVGRHSWRRTAARRAFLGPRCHLEDGPGLDRRTAQRIACDAALVAVLHHVGEGEPLRLGRKTRSISPAQRRALRIRDGGCRFPACHRRKYLEAHHVQHWSLLGPTDLENLVLLCRFHHMLIHEGGFRVSPAGDGGWEFHDPHGVLVPAAPALPGSAAKGSPAVRAPDPLGLFPGWAGEPFHLAETVAVLTRAPRVGVR